MQKLGAAAVLLGVMFGSAHAGQWNPPLEPGALLVATENVNDARFRHTVIVLAAREAYGSVGFILNRPSAVAGVREGGFVAPERRFKLSVPVGEDARDELRFNGYCGWQVGQLEREIAAGGWRTIEVDLHWAAQQAPASLWNKLQTWWGWAWL